MAASEYVSVHSQADTEEAELALERTKLKQDNKSERQALTAISHRDRFGGGPPCEGCRKGRKPA